MSISSTNTISSDYRREPYFHAEEGYEYPCALKDYDIIEEGNFNNILKYIGNLETTRRKIIFIMNIIQHDRLEIFTKVLNIENINQTYYTDFLSHAIRVKSQNIISYLIKNGVNITIDNTNIWFIMLNCSIDNLTLMIDYNLLDISLISENFNIICGQPNTLDKIKFFINLGANVNQNNDQPLINAIRTKNNEIAKYLIENGANIHARNNLSLKLSVSLLNPEMVEYLLILGANIKEINSDDIINVIKYYVQNAFFFTDEFHNTINILAKYDMDLSVINNTKYNKPNLNRFVEILVSKGIEPLVISNIIVDKTCDEQMTYDEQMV